MALKINYVDMLDWAVKFLDKILHEEFQEIEISENPDFVFCGTHGHDHFKYNCTKIFFTGEDIVPDFNLYDYAIGFADLQFEDRYFRFPLYYYYTEDYYRAIRKHECISDELMNRKFCNFIYSNGNAAPEREQFLKLLNTYKRVDSGGHYLNNIGREIEDKLEFQKQYKFSIAFENSSSYGYSTEKILQAFSAQTIPIYWGNPDIGKDFNTESFINCHDFENFNDVMEKVKELDNDDKKYLEMLSKPMMNVVDIDEKYEKLHRFLRNICTHNPEDARRRGTGTWNKNYENEFKHFYSKEKLKSTIKHAIMLIKG